MSRRRWRARVEDILAAIAEIRGFVAGMSFEEFRVDSKTLRAATDMDVELATGPIDLPETGPSDAGERVPRRTESAPAAESGPSTPPTDELLPAAPLHYARR